MRDEEVINAGTSFAEELRNLRDTVNSTWHQAGYLHECALSAENEAEEDRTDNAVYHLENALGELNLAITSWEADYS